MTRTPNRIAKYSYHLLTWTEILPWQRDNEFITTGYRQASFSYRLSLRSIFAIHNETANIWSHLLGAWFFASMLVRYVHLSWSDPELRYRDLVVLGIYTVCVSVCFGLSTFFHTFSDHSKELHRFGNELDHLGIVLVMWGTGISGTYFAFYCQPSPRNGYVCLLSGTALACALFTLQPNFRRPTFRTARFLTYCLLGASLFAPVVHGWCKFGSDLEDMMSLRSFLGLAFINFTGAAGYAARVPERWFPRTFDLLGQSHNWMHILVLVGALVRLQGLVDAIEWWRFQTHGMGFCSNAQ
ncbi:adiponectin receptor protein 1 [Xylariomycetidae sp. FL0641]|nr:adiponectin receptor protein 1 [Xylariomycetidae sp. FL0641]